MKADPIQADAYPLTWPLGRPRTPATKREEAAFQISLGSAIQDLRDQVRLLRVTSWVLSSNLHTRRDGLPYADAREPEDPGIAVWFVKDGEQRAIACDRWRRVRHNVRAVALTIEALRGIARWGSGEIVRQAFTGFAALPPHTGGLVWWQVLGVPTPDETLLDYEEAYARLALKAHPDRGGSHEEMVRLNRAIAEARAIRGAP